MSQNRFTKLLDFFFISIIVHDRNCSKTVFCEKNLNRYICIFLQAKNVSNWQRGEGDKGAKEKTQHIYTQFKINIF